MPKYDKSQFQLVDPEDPLYKGFTLEELQEEDRLRVRWVEDEEFRKANPMHADGPDADPIS